MYRFSDCEESLILYWMTLVYSESSTMEELSYFFLMGHINFPDLPKLKDLNSTVAKRGSVFIGSMTTDGAIWFRYQRTVLMR